MGDGIDTIIGAASPGAGNVVDFGIGKTSADLTLSADGNTLVISVGSTGDALRLEGFDPENPYSTVSIETFRFADGTVLDAAQLLDLGCTFEGTPADDTLTGTGARDLILGHEGDDQVLGGLGDDTYIFNPGDGNDTIIDRSTALEPNMLIFGAGILSDTVTLSHDPANNMLILNITSTRDTIRLSNFDSADPYGEHAIEYFQFGDGRILTYSQLIDKGFDIIGTGADDTLTGTATTDRIVGGEGEDFLDGGSDRDVLSGGT